MRTHQHHPIDVLILVASAVVAVVVCLLELFPFSR
jgi:hypothetical protein